MSASIRVRLLAGAALAVAIGFAAAGGVTCALARRALYEQFDAALLGRAGALSALLEQDAAGVEAELGQEPGLEGAIEYYQVWDARGAVIWRSPRLGQRDLVSHGRADAHDVVLPDGERGRQLVLSFAPRHEAEDGPVPEVQRVTLALARSTGAVDATLARIRRAAIWVGVVGTLACILVLAWVVQFGLRPLRRLASRIAAVREDELGTPIARADSPDEVRPVVDRLNELLQRLERALERERELTAEVAHELRTPLAGLRTTIEVALARDRPADHLRSSLADCLVIVLETERLVTAMLALARLDAGRVNAAATPVVVADVVRDTLLELADRVRERGIVVTTELAATTIVTDPGHVEVVIHNLLDNAVCYVDDGGSIHVAFDGARLVISNTGCTLAPQDAARVFERFWRGDQARAAGRHAGLGLALCKKVVALLGLELTVAVSEGAFVATLAFAHSADASMRNT